MHRSTDYSLHSLLFSISHDNDIPKTKKPPIVCIHGFGGNADQFRKNIPKFAESGHESYAIDLLGYGEEHSF